MAIVNYFAFSGSFIQIKSKIFSIAYLMSVMNYGQSKMMNNRESREREGRKTVREVEKEE